MPLEYASNAALTGDFDEKVQLISDTLHRPVCEDAVLRRFCVLGRRAALFYIDGMADDNKLLRGVIAPCQQARDMEWGQDTLLGEILSIASATPTTRLPTAIGSLMNGDALLLCEEIDGAIALDAKGFAKRGVQRTTGELVVQGPQEAFSESLRDNVVLLRRMMRTPALVSEAASVGSRVPARVCILYLDGVARKENIDEIKRRLDGCNVDYVSSLGMLEQLLEDSPYSLLPQIVTTERPDRAVSFLLSGQILLGLENAPQMLSMPMNMAELFHAPDDSSLRWQYGAFLRLLRMLGLLLALLVPPMFVALTNFHTEGMPLPLLTSVQEAQSQVPIGVFPATIGMLIIFSLINEACTRVPSMMGGSLGVVSALILGQAAAEADLVSPLLIVLVALSGLGSFVMPDYTSSIALRIAQLALVVAAGLAGYFGLVLCLLILMLHIFAQTSLGAPLCAPFAPRRARNPDLALRMPVWRQRLRGYLSNPAAMLRSRGRMRAWEKKDE